jgi:hypothetical protein
MRPNIYHGPLPRLKPQPEHITMMIWHRRLSRDRRLTRQRLLHQWIEDLWAEAYFEDALASREKFDPVFAGPLADAWTENIRSQLLDIHHAYARDEARKQQPYPPKLLEQIKEARREKVRNRNREHERQKKGEVLTCTLRRRLLGYPAHVSSRWSKQKRKEMFIVRRSASEVGYVGQLKRKWGWNIRGPEDQYDEEDAKRLRELAKSIRAENRRRRTANGDRDTSYESHCLLEESTLQPT